MVWPRIPEAAGQPLARGTGRERGEERGAERGEERRRGEERVRFNREISNFVKPKLNNPGHN